MKAITFMQLKCAELVEYLDKATGVLVDTLPPEHFEARHIPGAVNACVYEVTFLDSMAELVKDKATPIVLYGAGTESYDCFCAAEKLKRAGYTDLAVFPGGLTEWLEHARALDGVAADSMEAPHPMLHLEKRVYKLLREDSVIRWTGRNNNGGHRGTLCFSAGEVDATAGLSGDFTLDMNSIRNVDLEGDPLHPVLESHLKSDDFFFVKMFPEARFTAREIRLTDDAQATRPNAMIQGTLAMRGVHNEIAFPAHVRNLDEERIVVMGNLDFDRTQWGIIYGSSRFFQYLSYHLVFDFISIDFRIVLK
ncbi:MAG: hypothetical protein CL942_09005 [Desulfovibrio sp.]|nr:hypothetical protein [Desulfovibrio sp.]